MEAFNDAARRPAPWFSTFASGFCLAGALAQANDSRWAAMTVLLLLGFANGWLAAIRAGEMAGR